MFVVPVRDEGRGCSGERGSRNAQAAVPGSSEPSGQSHELSLTCDGLRVMDGWPIQAKACLAS